jgi:hypothetical protein
MISQRLSLYNDTKTEALYSQIANVHAPFSSEEEALLKEAEQKTEINSHYSLADPHQYVTNSTLSSATATSIMVSRLFSVALWMHTSINIDLILY